MTSRSGTGTAGARLTRVRPQPIRPSTAWPSRCGWSVPTTIPDEVVEELTTVVVIDVAADTRINGFRIARGSGNADFDQSVEAQMTRIQQSEGNIPPRPKKSRSNTWVAR